MATILLAAAGASVGAGIGGSVLGLSGAVIGRAVGATLGRAIDQRLLGVGSGAVETGRIDRFRIMGAGEGGAIARVHGRVRLAGQVIWASRFTESAMTTGGGKGAPRPQVTEFSYSVSLAVALCEGEILRLGRIWADGLEVAKESLNLRLYHGGEDQVPDPKMEAVEGAGRVPAYRGIAYVVFEDLALEPYGNRVPQFSFEVVRRAQGEGVEAVADLAGAVRGVALIPGSGEYALATTAVHFDEGPGKARSANVHNIEGRADIEVALEALVEELPGCRSVSLVVSWFGDDLRCGMCRVRPRVEQAAADGVGMPWAVAGVGRAAAGSVPQDGEGRPVYGGTPADAAVVEAIAAIRAHGREVMFYPFLLMEQMAGNALPDPWSGGVGQAVLPWRGRITTSLAPGLAGTPDRSAAAEAEVAAYFGAAQASDFAVAAGQVVYSGPPDDWGWRRMILHYAHLCAVAGGVDAFCIGSELRSLTQVRGAGDSFPAVVALRQLAGEVRAILGAGTAISYAADWSEYSGYDAGGGNRYFNLDALWADDNVDFIGIDNYMPVADWRDGEEHLDAHWGAIHDLGYLQANIEGGEGFEWFYPSQAARAAQVRAPIADGAYGEPWVFRFKDLRGWWENTHHDRLGGVRAEVASAWEPRSKPFRFTEFGCAAIDKGANAPNLFLDPKSSESALPAFSDGRRDDLMQMQYLRAVSDYWGQAAKNPHSPVYGGAMVDMEHAHVWAWDARPWPAFPGLPEVWADAANYARGHWLNGRASAQPLGSVLGEIAAGAGLLAVDVAQAPGLVRGYLRDRVETARAGVQPLLVAHGVEAAEAGGVLAFALRSRIVAVPEIDEADLALSGDLRGLQAVRAPAAEVAGRVRVGFVAEDGEYRPAAAEAVFPDDEARGVTGTELALVLTRAEGRAVAARWLAEARVAREGARFALPPSRTEGPGERVKVGGVVWRIDRIEEAGARIVEAVRAERTVHLPALEAEEAVALAPFVAPVPVFAAFLDLPLMRGDEVAHAPWVAAAADPWPGTVGVWRGAPGGGDAGHVLDVLLAAPAAMGVSESALAAAAPDRWDRGPALRVRLARGALASAAPDAVLEGANAMAIGSGAPGADWEVFQYAEAVAVAPGVWDIALRLRGQAGSDAVMPEAWPAGSVVVALGGAAGGASGGALRQANLAPADRGRAFAWRIGAAARGPADPAAVLRIEAFAGVGLRPYAPVHLRVRAEGSDLRLRWVRRTRQGGDGWEGAEVPLGEEAERYLLRLRVGGAVVREVEVTAPEWVYPAALQAADGAAGGFEVAVAQVSAQFGPGPFARLVV